MKITCPRCGYSGDLSTKLVPPEGRNVKCPHCRNAFFISYPSPSPPAPDPVVARPGRAEAVSNAPQTSPLDAGVATFVDNLSDDLRGKAGALPPGTPTCPQCGSVDIIWEKRGYSNQAGGWGCCLLGPVGLAAGLVGKDRPVRFCRSCANRWEPRAPVIELPPVTPEQARKNKIANWIIVVVVIIVFVILPTVLMFCGGGI